MALKQTHSWEEMGFGPYSVTGIQNWQLTLKDGVKLALKFWIPLGVEELKESKFKELVNEAVEFGLPTQIYDCPLGHNGHMEETFPVILEYLPYCKDDHTAPRDHSRHSWLASHGFVTVRGDCRGTGTSQGYYFDEYEPQEQADGVELVEWLGKTPWSNGSVGIYGKSWGGFNGLQIASHQPQCLKAVVSLYSSDDRFNDDVHYMGGCVIGNCMLSWASTMLLRNARPPHRKFFQTEEKWREFWSDRLKVSSTSWLETWLRNQTKNTYWKQGSVAENMDKIQCPVLAIGGLADGYTNAAFRMASTLNESSRTIIGPWSHDWPDTSKPGPNINFLQLCLSWFNKYLKSSTATADDVSKWPRLKLYVRDSIRPAIFSQEWPGKWINFPHWPQLYKIYREIPSSDHPADCRRFPDIPDGNVIELLLKKDGVLKIQTKLVKPELNSREKVPNATVRSHSICVESKAGQAVSCGGWLTSGDPDLPGDQRESNMLSTCFSTPPLEAQIVIGGFSVFRGVVSVDEEGKYGLAVRLCDVWPTGEKTLITYGMANLLTKYNEKEAEEHKKKSIPRNQRIKVEVALNGTAYTVPEGHRMEVAISPSYFPLMYPMNGHGSLWLHMEGSKLLVQTLTKADLQNVTTFPEPKPLLELPREQIRPPSFLHSDPKVNSLDEKVFYGFTATDSGEHHYPTLDVTVSGTGLSEFTTNHTATKGHVTAVKTVQMAFPQFETCVELKTWSKMEDRDGVFVVNEKLEVDLDRESFFTRKWAYNVPRDYV